MYRVWVELCLELSHQKDKLVAARKVEVLLNSIGGFRKIVDPLLVLAPQDSQSPSCLGEHRLLEARRGKAVLRAVDLGELAETLNASSVDSGDCTQRIEEVCEAGARGVQSYRRPCLPRTPVEPRIALDLL